MNQVDSELLRRVDVFLGLIGVALTIAVFYLMTIDILIGLLCFVTLISAAGAWMKGYSGSVGDAE